MVYDVNIKNGRVLIDNLVLLLYCIYILLKPFYFWRSGLPQISDCILVLMMLCYFIKNKLIIRFYSSSKKHIYTSLGFIIYVLFINTVWSLMLDGNIEFLTTSAFYIYNFLASWTFLMLCYEYDGDFYKYLSISIILSIFIQLAIYFAGGGFIGSRSLGSFNNPNQLGYHYLMMLAYLILMSQKHKVNAWLFLGSIFAAMILCLSSLSKAAIISYLCMLAFFIFARLFTKSSDKRIIVYLLIIALILSAAYSFNREIIASNKLYNSVINRISRAGLDNDDNLIGRGYYRLVNYPQYLIFGAGEGDYARLGYDIEFHSTLGNILMSYGAIGLLLYLTSIIYAVKNNKWKYAYLIFFILLYGLTHNGIRNTLLWMLIASISVANPESDADKPKSLRREDRFDARAD